MTYQRIPSARELGEFNASVYASSHCAKYSPEAKKACQTCEDNAIRYASTTCKGKKGKDLAACLEETQRSYDTWYCHKHTSEYMVRYFNEKTGKTYSTPQPGCVPCLRSAHAKAIAEAKARASYVPVIKGLGGDNIPMNRAWSIEAKSVLPAFVNDIRKYSQDPGSFEKAYARSVDPAKDWIALTGQIAVSNGRRSIVGAAYGGANACEMLDSDYGSFKRLKERDEVNYIRSFDQQGYNVGNQCLAFIAKAAGNKALVPPVISDSSGGPRVTLAALTDDLNKNGYKSKWFFFNRAWFVAPRFDSKTGRNEWGPDAKDIALAKQDKTYARVMTLPPTAKSIKWRGEQRKLFDKKKSEELAAATTIQFPPNPPPEFDPKNAIVTLSKNHKSWGEVSRLPTCASLSEDYINLKAAKAASEAARLATEAEAKSAADALADLTSESESILKNAGFSIEETKASTAASNSSDEPAPENPGEQDSEASMGTGMKLALVGAIALSAWFLIRRD